MEYEKLLTKLGYNYNIYDGHYSFDKIKELFLKDNDIDIDKLELLIFVILNGEQYSSFSKYLEKFKDNLSESDKNNLFLNFISISNHDSISLYLNSIKCISKIDEIDSTFGYNRNINMESGNFSLSESIDTIVDLLGFNFKLFNYITKNFKLSSNVINADIDINLFKTVNKFYILKSIYNYICFEHCNIISNKKNIYELKYDYDFHFLKCINNMRIQDNIYNEIIRPQRFNLQFSKNYNFNSVFIKNLNISEDTGIISFDIECLSNKMNERINKIFFKNISSIIYYSSHYNNNYLEISKNFLIVFSALEYLVDEISKCIKNKEYKINFYLFKIKKDLLFEYCSKISNLEYNKCLEIISAIINYGKESFWYKPLLENGDYLHIIFPSVRYNNIVSLVDTYMHNAIKTFKDNKGKLFEEYVKKEIILFSKRKKFFCKIAEPKKYKVSKKQSEEIDLLWETKHNLIIAEIKCIRYPFDSNLIERYYTIVKKAVEQVKRKSNFIFNNRNLFHKYINCNKKIIKLVITNYHLYSGLSIDNVPIIDIGIIKRYINIGKEGFIKFNSENNSDEELISSLLYNDEDEFCMNMENYFRNPNSIFKDRLEEKTIELDIDIFNKIYISTVIPKYNFNHEKYCEEKNT